MQLRPTSTIDYQEYWKSIKKYNEWFIKLRYFAVMGLLAFLFLLELVFDLEISVLQLVVFVISSGIISFYNFILARKIKREDNSGNNQRYLKFSLTQILLDLLLLSILTYFTGGLESPFFFFFIFHMIIGSLILPVRIIFGIALSLIVLFSSFSFMELYLVIPHFEISGLYEFPIFRDLNFVLGRVIFFSLAIFISIYLTSQIAKELYSRERELKIALDLLNEAEVSKQKYIMAVVHELKSPIAAASSFLDLVIGNYVGEVSGPVKDKLIKARARTGELTENINSILRISKFKLLNQIDKKELNLTKLVCEIIESVNPQVERKQQQLSFNRNNLVEIKINADEVLVKLALSNLIGNAVKYTPKQGAINICLNEKSLSISDTGIGIPKDELGKIFSEFYRASNATKNKIEGTGTGLNIVKQIIENHGWKINVDSPSKIGDKVNLGTMFSIDFLT